MFKVFRAIFLQRRLVWKLPYFLEVVVGDFGGRDGLVAGYVRDSAQKPKT